MITENSKNGTKITAEEGKTLSRISDGFLPGDSVTLGYTYYLHGEKLETPLLEIPEHYTEISTPLLSSESPLEVTPPSNSDGDSSSKSVYTVEDIKNMEDTIAELKKAVEELKGGTDGSIS